MAQLLAGSAFGQLITSPLNVAKPKQKLSKHGIMKKQKITSITMNNQNLDLFYYASDKNIYSSTFADQSQQTIFSNKYNSSKIIGIQSHQDDILAALNNGALLLINKDQQNVWNHKQILSGKFQPNLNKQYNKMAYDNQNSFCLVGKQVLPFLFDFNKSIVSWNGKNVPNDYLDLRVPVNDTDATFFKNKNHLACAHADHKVRVYDVRTNKQKPSADYHLKFEKVYNKVNLTRIITNSQNQNLLYVSNDAGAVYECDIRKQMQMTGKFKGINATVTDLCVNENQLFVSSLDSYVRVYNLESKELQQKYYMNKPIYSVKIKESDGVEDKDFEEQVLSQGEQNQVNQPQSKKMKKLRKRNKINLKYLKPVNWDEVPIKQQLLQQAKQQYEQINSKDADSYLDENQQFDVKDQHHSDEERDSDLD